MATDQEVQRHTEWWYANNLLVRAAKVIARCLGCRITNNYSSPVPSYSLTDIASLSPNELLESPHCGWATVQEIERYLGTQGTALRKDGTPVYPKPTTEQLLNRYSYHPPKDGQREKYEVIRNEVLRLATVIVSLTPCSPEQARALNALDEAMMLANAAIARNE